MCGDHRYGSGGRRPAEFGGLGTADICATLEHRVYWREVRPALRRTIHAAADALWPSVAAAARPGAGAARALATHADGGVSHRRGWAAATHRVYRRWGFWGQPGDGGRRDLSGCWATAGG